jgi:hypothetical protein
MESADRGGRNGWPRPPLVASVTGVAFLVLACGRRLRASAGEVVPPIGDGAPCANNGDCGVDSACVYRIADGCSAKPTCQKKPTGPLNLVIYQYCGCSGNVVYVGSNDPAAFAVAPVSDDQASCFYIDIDTDGGTSRYPDPHRVFKPEGVASGHAPRGRKQGPPTGVRP